MTIRDSISAVTSGLRVDTSAATNDKRTWRDFVLRGGRVTKHKGIGCGIAPHSGVVSAVLGVAAVSAFAFGGVVLTTPAALAGSCSNLAISTCSGAAGAPGTDAPVAINQPGTVTVTTDPGFGIDAGGGFAAITITGSGVGDITFTDVNQSAITSATNVGIRVFSGNTGSVGIETNGVITSASTGVGVDLGANTTDVTVQVNDVDAGGHGIHVQGNTGTGDVSITANDVKANNIGINIDTGTQTQDFTVDVNSITTSVDDGIFGFASGTGDVNITVRESIVAQGAGGVFGDGIEFQRDNTATGQFNVTVNDVTASGRGLALVQHSAAVADQSLNSLNVTTNGKIDAGNWAIWTETNPGVLSNITVKSTSVLVSGTGQAIFNDDGDSHVIIENAAEVVDNPTTPETEISSVNGAIRLNGGVDRLDLHGGFSGITSMDGGGQAGDTLNVYNANSTYDADNLGSWDVINLTNTVLRLPTGTDTNVGAAADMSNGLFLYNSVLDVSENPDYDSWGNMSIDATSAFYSRGDAVGNGVLILGGLRNNGLVSLATPAGVGVAGDTLTVQGQYSGTGGTIIIDTVLGDDSSVTDRMILNGGTAAGTTSLVVNNIGGAGAATSEGIKVIDVSGDSLGTFSLVGDYEIAGQQAVIAGAYGYTLWKNGVSNPTDGDWYLRSQLADGGKIYAPGVPIYEAYGQVLLGLNGLPTLQQRVGNRYWKDAVSSTQDAAAAAPDVVTATADVVGAATPSIDQSGVWGVIEGSYAEYDPDTSTSGAEYDLSFWKMRAGIDGLVSESERGKIIAGLNAFYGQGSSDISSLFGSGDISTDAYGIGATATWYDNNGFYLDGQGQLSWFDSDLKSDLLGELASGNNGFGYALSLEAGQRIDMHNNWTVIPQAQLVYSNVTFDSFDDQFGAEVKSDRADSLRGRLGLAMEHQNSWTDEQGQVERATFYGITNLHYEFLDGVSVDVADTEIVSENDALWGEVGLGGSFNWGDDGYSIYGEISANSSLENVGDSYVLNGKGGLRINW